jgi:hypothetical protein
LLEQWRLTKTLSKRWGKSYQPAGSTSENLSVKQVFTVEVEQMLALLRIAPVSFRALQKEVPPPSRIKSLYPNGFTDEDRVRRVLIKLHMSLSHRADPWNQAHRINWDKIEHLLTHSPAKEILTEVFSRVVGLTLRNLEKEAEEEIVMGPGPLPSDRRKKRVHSRPYSWCPYERKWQRDELFGYRFEVMTIDHVMVYTYGNPPEQDEKCETRSYHATLRQAIEASFDHLAEDDPDREVSVYFKGFNLLSGFRNDASYSWQRHTDRYSQWNAPCPVNGNEVRDTLLNVEAMKFGSPTSAENFLMGDLGL